MRKDHDSAYRVLEEVAKREKMTLQEVVASIEEAINAAYCEALEKDDCAVLRRWEEIPCEGNLPSAVELLEYLSGKAAECIG